MFTIFRYCATYAQKAKIYKSLRRTQRDQFQSEIEKALFTVRSLERLLATAAERVCVNACKSLILNFIARYFKEQKCYILF